MQSDWTVHLPVLDILLRVPVPDERAPADRQLLWLHAAAVLHCVHDAGRRRFLLLHEVRQIHLLQR